MKSLIGLVLGLILVATPASAFDPCQSGTYNTGGPVIINVGDAMGGFYCINNVDNLGSNPSTEATFPLTSQASQLTVENTSSAYIYGSVSVVAKGSSNAYVFSGAPRVIVQASGMSKSIIYGGTMVNLILTENAESSVAEGNVLLSYVTGAAKMTLHGGVYPQQISPNVTLSCNAELIVHGYNIIWNLLPSDISRPVSGETIYNTVGEPYTYGVLKGNWYDGSNFSIAVELNTAIDCDLPVIPGDLNNDGCVNFRDLAIMRQQFFNVGPGFVADLNQDGVVNFADLAILKQNFFRSASSEATKNPKITIVAYTPPACGILGIEVLPVLLFAAYRRKRKIA